MRLKLSDLQRVVKQTLQEKKHNDAFCDEIKAAFGPSVIVRDNLESLVEAANERLDVLEYTNRLDTIKFSENIALDMINHESAEVRKLVARVLPEGVSNSLVFDDNDSVRLAAAKKVSIDALQEATDKFPADAALKEIFEARALNEESALEASKQHSQEDMLSDSWYEGVARKLIQDYGRTLDTTWKSSAVLQYCSAARATTRLPVDPVKLMGTMSELLAKHDEARAEMLGLTEGVENISETFDAIDTIDFVDELMKESLSPQEFIDRCNDLFEIRFATLPPAIMKYKIREGLSLAQMPVSCTLPHGSAPRRIDEIALDSYVKHWNDKQKMMGEPFKLSWDTHPESVNKISFTLELK